MGGRSFLGALRRIRELAAEGQDLKLAEIFGLPEDLSADPDFSAITREVVRGE